VFPDEIVTYTSLFKEFHDIFTWSYEEMPGIDPAIVVHEIKTYPALNPSGNTFVQFTHVKRLLSSSKLRNF
jgi:hypothetical protein